MKYYQIPLLVNLHSSLRNLIESSSQVHHYRKGQIIHLEEDECNALEVILSGKVGVSYSSMEGEMYTIKVLEEGSFISPNNLFSSNRKYFTYVEALENTSIYRIPIDAIDTALEDKTFRISFLQLLSDTGKMMGSKLIFERHTSLRVKIILYLKHQSILQQSSTITLPLSKTILANQFGVARTSLSRELQKMQEEDLIQVSNKVILLRNL